MSGMGEWLESQFQGDARKPETFTDLVRAVVKSSPSRRAAARTLGVPESTLRRWEAGAVPKAGRDAVMAQAWRQSVLGPNRPADKDVTIKVPRGRGTRTIGQGLKLTPGTMDRAATVWVATGDREQAARAFVSGIGDATYQRLFRQGLRYDGGDTPSMDEDSSAGLVPV